MKTVMVAPPGCVVVAMGVDEIGVEVVGVGVELVVGVGVVEEEVVREEVLSIEEVEGLEEGEEVETGGGLLLAIELEGGSEVVVGDDEEEEVVGTPVSVLVELVDIVNCLLNTSFLGCLCVAMSARRNSHGCAASTTSISVRGRGASYLKA